MDAAQYSEEVLAEQRASRVALERLAAPVEALREEQRAQTRALELLAAPARDLQERELRAAFPPLRRVLGGKAGTVCLLRAFPGFAGLWEEKVPSEYVRTVDGRHGGVYRIVGCVCGAMTALEEMVVGCSGACGRWFLPLESDVRVKRFEETA